MDVSKGFAVPHVAAQSIRRLRIHEILGTLLCLALLASTFEKVYQSQTLLVSFCTQALNMTSRGALPHSTSVISDNLSLGLTTDVSSERLYDLTGHHSLPSLITANKAERSTGQPALARRFRPVLYILCVWEGCSPLGSSLCKNFVAGVVLQKWPVMGCYIYKRDYKHISFQQA